MFNVRKLRKLSGDGRTKPSEFSARRENEIGAGSEMPGKLAVKRRRIRSKRKEMYNNVLKKRIIFNGSIRLMIKRVV